jgi:hypothetical protein
MQSPSDRLRFFDIQMRADPPPKEPLTLPRDITVRWNSSLLLLLRARKLRTAIGLWQDESPKWSTALHMTPQNWLQVDILIGLGLPFLYFTNEISTRECTLSDTVTFMKMVLLHLDRARQRVGYGLSEVERGFLPSWTQGLPEAVQSAYKKAWKYALKMQQSFDTFAIAMLLDPPAEDERDHRFRGNGLLWNHFAGSDGKVDSGVVQLKAERAFLSVYTKYYAGTSDSGTPTGTQDNSQAARNFMFGVIMDSSPQKVFFLSTPFVYIG